MNNEIILVSESKNCCWEKRLKNSVTIYDRVFQNICHNNNLYDHKFKILLRYSENGGVLQLTEFFSFYLKVFFIFVAGYF